MVSWFIYRNISVGKERENLGNISRYIKNGNEGAPIININDIDVEIDWGFKNKTTDHELGSPEIHARSINKMIGK